MTNEFLFSLISVLAVSLVSLFGLFTISMKTLTGKKVFAFLVSFAAAALLGDVFFHLLPELAENGQFNLTTSSYVLLAIFALFLFEKYLHWHHHHGDGDENEHATHPFVFNILVGDSLHNFIDGLIIAAAYQINFEAGLATTIAVLLHEIPQEIGDFGVLVYGGFTKAKALLYNFISALSAAVGAGLAFLLGDISNLMPILISLGAGTFIYIAVADLIPQIHKEKKQSIIQLASFVLGIAAMFALLYI